MITLNEAKAYLRVDLADEADEYNLQRAIEVADKWMIGAVGRGYDDEDPREKELMLKIVGDIFDNRTTTEMNQNNVNRLFYDLALQLRLELGGSQNG